MIQFEYKSSTSIADVFGLLENSQHETTLLAGGTDLVNHLRIGKRSASQVVDLKNVKELNNRIDFVEGAGLTIGALATLTEIEFHQVVRVNFRALSEAVNKIGSTQIRNRGTLAGNICNASPAADAIPALLIYDSTVNIISRDRRRSVPLERFVKGPGQIDLNKGELVESIFIPAPPEHTSCYLKLARREGADLTTVGVAALVMNTGEVRVALGAVGPRPFRAYSAEQLLNSRPLTDYILEAALDRASSQASPISDLRGSKEYRKAMVKVYVRKALDICQKRFTE